MWRASAIGARSMRRGLRARTVETMVRWAGASEGWWRSGGGDDFRDAEGRHAERASSRRELVFRIHRKRRWCVRRWFHPGVARTRAGSQTTGNVHRSTSTKGLHHLVWEVLDNSVDEVQAGHASHVRVTVESDGFVSVMDDGRGIPTDIHPVTGKSSLETVLTILHAGGKFGGDDSGYHVSGGLHGVGISVVNALSETVDVTVWRDGKEHAQSFSEACPSDPMTEKQQQGSGRQKGTMIRFKPDDQIFDKVKFDANIIRTRMKELAFLNSGTELHLRTYDKKTDSHNDEKLLFADGLKDYVLDLTSDATRLHDPITFSGVMEGVRVEGALCWTADCITPTRCWVTQTASEPPTVAPISMA